MFIQSKPKRLLQDKIGELEDDLDQNPTDYLKWNRLIDQIVLKDNQEQVRQTFDKYLKIFKHDSTNWCKYIKYELSRGEKEKVESLFEKCFKFLDSVEICRLYVDYVRSVTDFITGGDKARGTVIQAFEFAISKAGLDINSDTLWQDYLGFIKAWTTKANWEQQQKVDLIRKIYKKFLVIPTENIETSWTQYTKWENELNSSTAQKFISEKSSEFMLARSWMTEWHNITNRKLKRSVQVFKNDEENQKLQIKYWKNWIDLEKKNNLELKDEFLLESRIKYAYKQSSYSLPFIPQTYFEYTKYLLSVNEEGNLNECIEILKDGLALNPKSLLLSFQLTELYEKDHTFDKAKDVFEHLIKILTADYNQASNALNELNERIKPKSPNEDEASDESDKEEDPVKDELPSKNLNGATGVASLPPRPNLPPVPTIQQLSSASEHTNGNGSIAPQIYKISLADEKLLNNLDIELKNLKDAITLIYIKYMIASKRAEGMKEARNVFKMARKFEAIGYQIFVNSALLEHYSDNKKTALKIFDLGKKVYSTDGQYLLEYLNYLIMVNDVDSIRNIIQSSDTNLSKDISQLNESLAIDALNSVSKSKKEKELKSKKKYLKKLYKTYISFASAYLSLDITNSFAKKCEQLFPEDDPIDLFTDRYKLNNLNLIKKLELGEDGIELNDLDEDLLPVLKKRKMATITSDESDKTIQNIQETSSRIEQEVIQEHSQGQPQNNIVDENVVGPSIVALMNVLPNASYFGLPSESVFNSEKLVVLFANLPNIS